MNFAFKETFEEQLMCRFVSRFDRRFFFFEEKLLDAMI